MIDERALILINKRGSGALPNVKSNEPFRSPRHGFERARNLLFVRVRPEVHVEHC